MCCFLGKKCHFVLISSTLNSITNDSRPHAVAIGDFNKDGLSDIVVPNSGMDNIGVFFRLTNGSFTNQITYSTGSDSTPYAVAVADFNHDQQLDIVVANFDSHNIGIFFGRGNGNFRPQITFPTGSSRPRSIAVGDFNSDKELDIVVINYGTNNIGVFLQDKNGNFANQTVFSTGYDSDPYSLAVGDLNNDNKTDILVANSGTNNVGIFLGHGNGTFEMQTIFSTGINSHPHSIAIGNLNSDSYLDIAVACPGTNNIGVLLGYGDGTFTIPIMYSTGNNSLPLSVAIDDFDNDNKFDIAFAKYGIASVVILFGDGNGYFSDKNKTFFTSSNLNPYSIAVGDFNIDNRPDIAVVNYDFNRVDIILNYRNYSFYNQITYKTNDNFYPTFVLIHDLNNDQKQDIIVVNYGGSNLGIFLGFGNGTFSNQTTYSTGDGTKPLSIAVGDFNNDSQLDIVVANGMTNNVGIFLGHGNGTFSSQTTFSTGVNSHPYAVAVDDFNNDNRLDVAVANSGSHNVGIFLGYGDGTFASQVTYSTDFDSDYQPNSIAVGDFNNDSQLDLVVTNLFSSNIGVFHGYGNGTFSNQMTYSTKMGTRPNNAVVGDLNNDGQVDIVVTLSAVSGILVFLGNGNGTFSRQLIYTTGSQSAPSACVLADVNNDHRLDAVVTDEATGKVVILHGDGHGHFFDVRYYSTGSDSSPKSVTFGDFNNDNILDIVVANFNVGTIGVFLSFTYISGVREGTYSTGSFSHPRAVTLADFNKDEKLDIAMTNYGLGNVGVLLNDANKAFGVQIMLSTGDLSLPASIAAGDLNSDSELDLVVANSGSENLGILYGQGNGSFSSQTTFSTGLRSIPISVMIADINDDKKLDIVVADCATDSILTLLKYDIGALEKHGMHSTGTNSFPVSVAVGDLNNDGWLDFVVANYGSHHVGVFLGLGHGFFSNQTTYPTGSGSFPRSIALADFNNDTYLDMIVCNFWGNTIGIFLSFGNGTFSDGVTYSTGENSHPQSIAIGDLNDDNYLDIVVANNNDNNIGVFLGYNNGIFSTLRTYSTGSNSVPCSVAIGDFNNDNQLDIIVVNYLGDGVGIFIGYNNGTFSDMITRSTGSRSRPLSVVVGDLNDDERLDVIIAFSVGDKIGVFFGNGDGTFENQMILPTGRGSNPYSIVIADFNADNQLDIAIGNFGSNSFSVLLGFVNGTFFDPLNYFIDDGSQPVALAAADVNNDHRLDIIVVNSGIDNVGVFRGFVNESFLTAPIYSLESFSRPTAVAVGDFDNDTRLDIVVANNGTDNVMVLFGSGYGTFIKQTSYSTGNNSNPRGISVADFNSDSRLDIVVANSNANNIGVFLSNGTGTFSKQITYSTGIGSQPCSVAVLDFNNDTRLDIAVANYGSNSVSILFGDGYGRFTNQLIFNTGFDSHPFAVVVGDVNNDNLTDIIATNNGYGNVDIIFMEC